MRSWLLAPILAWAWMAGAAQAATVVTVSLGDPADLHPFRMIVDKTSAKAGAIEFDVTNLSKTMVHEMIVVSVTNNKEKLPYDPKKGMVEEDRIKDLGEASDLPPKTTKTLRLALAPGLYRLICNQPGHYKAGMGTNFTVTQ